MKKALFAFLIFAVAVGIAGAIVSIVMVVSAVSFMEWGRVIVYSVTTIACTEMAILAAIKLRKREKS